MPCASCHHAPAFFREVNTCSMFQLYRKVALFPENQSKGRRLDWSLVMCHLGVATSPSIQGHHFLQDLPAGLPMVWCSNYLLKR